MFAITREHVVVFSNGGNRADADCFLSDVQVTEAADLSGDIHFRRLLFEATDQEHLPVEFDQLIDLEPAAVTGLSVVPWPRLVCLSCFGSGPGVHPSRR